MRKSRFTEEQIVHILQEHAAGQKTAEVCGRHGISAPTLYGWKAKYEGISVSSAKRLRQLEQENGHLRRLLAEALLNNALSKGGASQKI